MIDPPILECPIWIDIESNVVYHPNTGCLAGIGMVLALVGWYIRLVFYVLWIWRECFFEEVSGNIYFLNCGKPFFPQKGG
jgi:hypothetical protein